MTDFNRVELDNACKAFQVALQNNKKEDAVLIKPKGKTLYYINRSVNAKIKWQK